MDKQQADAVALLLQVPEQINEASQGLINYDFLQQVLDFIKNYKANPSGAAAKPDETDETDDAAVAAAHKIGILKRPPLGYFVQGWNARPIAAGPVWVDGGKRTPPDKEDYPLIMNMGSGDDPVFVFSVGAYDPVRKAFKCEVMGHYLSCERVQWLDENATQRVFTREQVSKAYADGAIAAQLRAGGYSFQTEIEYMNTNYPIQ